MLLREQDEDFATNLNETVSRLSLHDSFKPGDYKNLVYGGKEDCESEWSGRDSSKSIGLFGQGTGKELKDTIKKKDLFKLF